MKNRRNLIIYRNIRMNISLALCFAEDAAAEKMYLDIIDNPNYDHVEWFGREYNSYELEVSSEDC